MAKKRNIARREGKKTASPAPERPLEPQRKLLLWALVGGLLFGLSQPLVVAPLGEDPIDPTGLSGLLCFIAFVPALVWMREHGPKRGYWMGFFTLWAGYTIILYWVVVAMTVFGHIPLVPSVMALLLLSGAMSFYLASAFGVTRVICRHFGLPQWAVFPVAYTAANFLINYGPVGGFPWGSPGYALTTVPILLQGAALVGVYGLSFLVALVNAALAEGVFAWWKGRPLPRRALTVLGAAMLAWIAWGAFWLAVEPEPEETVRVGMLQGNIEQGIKNKSRQNARFILDKYHRLQRQALDEGAEVVVWPEAAFPWSIPADRPHLRGAGIVPPADEHAGRVPKAAVIGAVVVKPYVDEDGQKRWHRYNTAVLTDERLDVHGRFDKAHLVPFGEYVPWPLNRLLRQIVPGGSTPGEGFSAKMLPVGKREIPIGVTICYEGIFPEITRAFVKGGARLMVNVTNDAWYGISSAAIQHLRMYAMRAVESGRAVARAANTGITAWVDPRGRLHDRTRVYTDAVVVADMPLSDETTPYQVLGDWVAVPSTLLALGLWIWALLGRGFWRRRRSRVEWVVGAVGLLGAAMAVGVYFLWPEVRGDEGAANRATAACVAGLLVGVGALSGRPWGRTAQLWVGGIAFVLCGAGAVAGAWLAFPIALAGGVIAVLAHRRREAYRRELDPPAA